MFDRTAVILPPAPTSSAPIRVTVNRAATDESVKLLKEMESAAREKIEHAIAVRDNGFEGVVHFDRMMDSDTVRTRVIFKLNGKKMSVECVTEPGITNNDYYGEVVGAVSVKVAETILMNAFEKIDMHKFYQTIK